MNDLAEFETSALHHGWRIDTVNGQKHYVSKNGKGIAMVGPRARRRKGWGWPLKKRKATEGQAAVLRQLSWDGDAVNPSLVRIAQDEVKFLETVPRMTLNFPSPPASPQKPGAFTRFKERWLSRFYDPIWHQAIKHSAMDVIMWAVALLSVTVLVKGMLWVISL